MRSVEDLHSHVGGCALNPQSIEPPASLRLTQSSEHSHSLKDAVSLSQLVHDSIMACDVDVRAALLQNIVVVGNTSLLRGLTERLDVELASLMPSVSGFGPSSDAKHPISGTITIYYTSKARNGTTQCRAQTVIN